VKRLLCSVVLHPESVSVRMASRQSERILIFEMTLRRRP
jgi:hypothetical protein